MKKLYKITPVLILLLIVTIAIIYNFYRLKPLEFPDESAFMLSLSCEDSVAVGETANITVSFFSDLKEQYEMVYFNVSFFKITVNDEILTPQGEGTFTRRLTPGENSNSIPYTYTPSKAGTYTVKATVEFEIRLSPENTKEYRLEKSTLLEVTEH